MIDHDLDMRRFVNMPMYNHVRLGNFHNLGHAPGECIRITLIRCLDERAIVYQEDRVCGSVCDLAKQP